MCEMIKISCPDCKGLGFIPRLLLLPLLPCLRPGERPSEDCVKCGGDGFLEVPREYGVCSYCKHSFCCFAERVDFLMCKKSKTTTMDIVTGEETTRRYNDKNRCPDWERMET